MLFHIRKSAALIRWPDPANSPKLHTFSDNAASQCTKFPNRQPYLIQPMIIKQHTPPHAQHLPFPSELSNLSSAWADFQRLQRMGINATHVYSEKHRANSKRERCSGRPRHSGMSVHTALCCYRHRAYGSTLWLRWMWKPEPPAARADWNGSQCFNMFLLRPFTHSGVTAWFQVVKCLSIRVWKNKTKQKKKKKNFQDLSNIRVI